MNGWMMKRAALLVAAVLIMLVSFGTAEGSAPAEAAGAEADLLEEAVRLGIIDEETKLRADEPAMEKEIPAMIQAAHRHGYGKDSSYLSGMSICAGNRQASRYWFAMAIYYSYCEEYYDARVKDAWSFMDEMDEINPEGAFGQFDSDNFGVIHNNKANFNPDWDGLIRGGAVWELCVDADVLNEGGEGMDWRHDFGNWWVAQVSFTLYDRVTGEKVLGMDENQYWNPGQKLTVGDAARAAVRYWRFFEDPAEKVPYAEVGEYDHAIITDELLARQTTLPANSCAHLPAEWHGQLIGKWSYVALGATQFYPDRIMREDDMHVLKGAGFNMLKFNLSFSYLQAPEVTPGTLNETRLKELDKLLALCMEHDIHLSLACVEKPDHGELEPFDTKNGEPPENQEEIDAFAAVWGAIARRYAGIPNEYLSFNIHCEPAIYSDEDYVRIYKPSVDAIRAASPDRTIIADVHSVAEDGTCIGAGPAGMGVALSYHLYDPRSFFALNDLPDMELQNDPEYLHSVTWPYRDENGRVYTAETMMDLPLFNAPGPEVTTLNRVRAIAEQYGVGFMVNEFGIFGEYRFGGFSRYRYTDETIYGCYTDMITLFGKEGIGWVNGCFNETWGIVQVCPVLEDVEYQKVGYYYVDTKMQAFFRKMCEGTE